MNTELIVTPVAETDHEIFVRTQLALINEKLERIETKVETTHKVLDMAFSRFEAMSKSPLLGTLFGSIAGKKKE